MMKLKSDQLNFIDRVSFTAGTNNLHHQVLLCYFRAGNETVTLFVPIIVHEGSTHKSGAKIDKPLSRFWKLS